MDVEGMRMKKLLLPICIIALLALLLSAVKDKRSPGGETPRFTSVSEAAFSMRNAGAEDATSYLVGNFTGEKGEKLCFSGDGDVKQVRQDLSSETGKCSLLQSPDGAAILQMEFSEKAQNYAFRVVSPDGQFILTDPQGATETFVPVP